MGRNEAIRSPKGIYICDMIETEDGGLFVHLKYKKKEDYIPFLDYIKIIMGCNGDEKTCDKHYCKRLNTGCLLKAQ